MGAQKIMYLMDGFDYAQGGTEGQVLQLIQHLDRLRYEPCITFLRRSDYIERNGFVCPVTTLNVRRIVNLTAFFKLLSFGWYLRRHGYLLVHCYFNDVSLVGPILLRPFGVRVLVSRRDMGFWYSPFLLVLLRLVSRFVDRYIVNSKAVEEVVHKCESVPLDKIRVIYNGYAERANPETIDSIPITDTTHSGPIIGIVANLSPVKRIDVLILAFAALSSRHRDARLIIIGDSQKTCEAREVYDKLRALVEYHGLESQVVFWGSIVDPSSAIKSFTVAVLCSESEGFSNSIIEYMQAGKPIVCTATGGNPELIEDGVTGLLVPVGDVDALASQIELLLSSPGLARAMGEQAREKVRKYSCKRMVDEHMALYDAVLKGHGQSVVSNH